LLARKSKAINETTTSITSVVECDVEKDKKEDILLHETLTNPKQRKIKAGFCQKRSY
jgi:hypothetical protein